MARKRPWECMREYFRTNQHGRRRTQNARHCDDARQSVANLRDDDLKVRRNKDIERRNLIDRLTKMSIEQRKVEDDLKKYRLEHWHIGKEKGLYEYDKNAFDREIEQFVVEGNEGGGGEEAVQMEQNELDESEDILYNRGGIDIEGMAADDGVLDMDYNYNDDEEGDFAED